MGTTMKRVMENIEEDEKWISYLQNITQVQVLNETLISNGYKYLYKRNYRNRMESKR